MAGGFSGGSSRPVADAIARQAAEWAVRLNADDPAERREAEAGFERWKCSDPRHAEAAARIERFLEQVRGLRESADAKPAQAALASVLRPRTSANRLKRAGAALAIAALLAVPAWLVLDIHPPATLLADVATATGRWETRTLADGTRLTLNGASAVNLRFDAGQRTLDLVQGEILVDVAPDPARPFLVETADGSIRALGTRFVVRRDRATLLTMLDSKVSVRRANAADGEAGTVVRAGQRVRITRDRLGPIEEVDTAAVADAWRFHQLVVQGSPLPDVLDELGRHRPGLIRFDREALAGIKVSAVLPLDDTDRALRLLSASFPALRFRSVTPYLVLVDMR